MHLLDAQLHLLQGCTHDYSALGRKLPANKDTKCTLWKATAQSVVIAEGRAAARVELVGDRFLRRQVRTLVATALQVASSAPDDASELLLRSTSGQQQLTAHPAPPYGLCFVEAGYSPWCVGER